VHTNIDPLQEVIIKCAYFIAGMHKVCTIYDRYTLCAHSVQTVRLKCAHNASCAPSRAPVCPSKNRKYRRAQFSPLNSILLSSYCPLLDTPKVECTTPLKVCSQAQKCAHVCTVCTVCSRKPADGPSFALLHLLLFCVASVQRICCDPLIDWRDKN
jgi:hypothetical protein